MRQKTNIDKNVSLRLSYPQSLQLKCLTGEFCMLLSAKEHLKEFKITVIE